MVARVLDVRVSRPTKRHFLSVGQVHRVSGKACWSVFVPNQERLVGGDGEGGLRGYAVIESQGTASDDLVGVVVGTHRHLNRSAFAVREGHQLLSIGVGDGEGCGDHVLRGDVVDLALTGTEFTCQVRSECAHFIGVAFWEVSCIFSDGKRTGCREAISAVEGRTSGGSIDAVRSILMAVGIVEVRDDVASGLVDVPP